MRFITLLCFNKEISSLFTSVFFFVVDPPDAPFILPIYFSDIGERWIIVKWQATSDPKSPLRYFTLQLNKHGQGWQVYSSNVNHTARSLKVEGLIPGESYMFRIMATNDWGNSPYSAASTPTSTRLACEYNHRVVLRLDTLWCLHNLVFVIVIALT